MAEERLQKLLARAGVGSRRACEELIAAGAVTVNGRLATLGQKVDAEADRIEVRGQPVALSEDVVYYALHKPAGVVTTARDPQGRATVLDYVPPEPRVFPVGRLDKDTSGLLLLTNDGEFALRLTHPRYGVRKTYLARVSGTAGPRHTRTMRSGLELEDGFARADSAKVVDRHRGQSLVEVVVSEGRNRLVRRLLEAAGLTVLDLTRVAIGPLRLGSLKPGGRRRLSHAEVHALLEAAGS